MSNLLAKYAMLPRIDEFIQLTPDATPMQRSREDSDDFAALKRALRLDRATVSSTDSPELATLLPMYAADSSPRPGSLRSDNLNVDSHWHYHDMHQLFYAFESVIEVESPEGRHFIPPQLAAWIPAGVKHRTSIHRVPSVSIFFRVDMLDDSEQRIRTVMVSPLMREMMREALRWSLHEADSPLRTVFFDAMAKLCEEWIKREAELFLPTSKDARLKRALDYTAQHIDAKLAEVCRHAGISERSLRRHLKTEVGMTWEAYRQRSRLLQAITLLSETHRSVAVIAAECGFESPSAFAKVFRQMMGDAPSDYRKRIIDTIQTTE